ncbi:MAG: 2-oxoacid:acceptor oxidoreductase family protein, partial [Candidatus Omnitrophota bacterium]|nr:2-oxoacid:acceptor oxidoreductase family protein [Candidatus Omnitrophota bacterium]
KGGILILDKEKFNPKDNNSKFFNVPFYKMAQDTGGSEIFINSVTSGLIAGILRLEFSYTEEILKSIFHNKDKEVIETNIKAAKSGYAFAKSNFKKDSFTVKKCGKTKDHFILNGNEAIGLGAIYAGCKFYSAYPMSPSTGIMNLVAHYAEKLNIVVEQAEDEIAAINMIIGASFAGARAMTSTSGGGFALMHEGISLAAMTETPVVIANAQRPAPATGFPTRTEQGDLDFLIHSGHGEFAKVVYTPGTIEEAFYLTMKAFDIAEKYQVPVLILTDQHLADSNRNIDPANLKIIKIERHIISKSASKDIKEYKRYKLTKSGISPRAIPSWIDGVIYADSDEHTESGHITEDGAIRVKMVEKRLHKKMALLKKDTEKLKTHNLDNAHTVIIG